MTTIVPTLLVVGADNGGVGKTTVTRVVLDYLTSKRIPARVFDTEAPTGDLVRFASAEIVDIETMAGQMTVFDGVRDGVTVVDLRAGTLTSTIRALDQAMMLEDVRQGAINLVLLHVIGPSVRSLAEIAPAVEQIGGGGRQLVVKNHTNDAEFAPALGDAITVGKLDEKAWLAVDDAGGSFLDFAANREHSRTLRGNVLSWLKAAWTEFDRVKLGELLGAEAPEARPT